MESERYAVSPDRRYLVYDTHSVDLARFDGQRYASAGTIEPEQLAPAEDQPQDLAEQQFYHGRLYFAKVIGPVDPDTGTRTLEVGWYSVDPADPGTVRAESEQTAPPRQHYVSAATGLTSRSGHPLTASLVYRGGVLRSAEVFPKDHRSDGYRCYARLSATKLLCLYRSDDDRDSAGYGDSMLRGTIASLTVAADQQNATLDQVVGALPDRDWLPQSDQDLDGYTDVYLSPDKQRMLFGNDTGWYVGPADGHSTPRFLTQHLGGMKLTGSDSVVLGWSRHGAGIDPSRY